MASQLQAEFSDSDVEQFAEHQAHDAKPEQAIHKTHDDNGTSEESSNEDDDGGVLKIVEAGLDEKIFENKFSDVIQDRKRKVDMSEASRKRLKRAHQYVLEQLEASTRLAFKGWGLNGGQGGMLYT